jgi:hypothetical protein
MPTQKEMETYPDTCDKLIVSLYDSSEAWPQPYADAGYPVMFWDMNHEGDIIHHWSTFMDNIEEAIEEGYYPYGLLAAPPCDHFASSGARWWKEKDASTERVGHKDIAENNVDLGVLLAEIPMLILDQVEQHFGYEFKWWALENPVGRIEKMCPDLKPYRKMMFDPCDYGDPYTKKTILWGTFNPDLPKTPVEPEYVTYVKKDGSLTRFAPQFGRTGGKSAKTKAIRSKTPSGFAKAFFQANQ